MRKRTFLTGAFCGMMMIGAVECRAAEWIKNDVDIPNKNLEANYYDGASVTVKDKTLRWTEKFILTEFGAQQYTKHLSEHPACKAEIAKKGNVTNHQIDFELKGGKFRTVAKRNYNKDGELVCTDKEMGKEFDTGWKSFDYGSPMYFRYSILAQKYKIGDI